MRSTYAKIASSSGPRAGRLQERETVSKIVRKSIIFTAVVIIFATLAVSGWYAVQFGLLMAGVIAWSGVQDSTAILVMSPYFLLVAAILILTAAKTVRFARSSYRR